MNHNPELDRVVPLSAGSSERARLRAPRLLSGIKGTSGFVMGNRAFMRTWAARRASVARTLCPCLPGENHGQSARATSD